MVSLGNNSLLNFFFSGVLTFSNSGEGERCGKRLAIYQLVAEAAMSERTGREIMTFSPIVHRAVSGAAGVAAGNNGSVVQSFRPHTAR